MSQSTIIADGVAPIPHINIFDKIWANRIQVLELNKLLIYLIDECPVEALPVLAEQFNVLGFGGWKFADTEEKKRSLLKRAIELHKHKGTPWSIIEALKAIGFLDVEIIEGLHVYHNGAFDHTGENIHGGQGLFYFKVVVDLGSDYGINDEQTSDIIGLIYEYKNARSWLLSLSFTKTIEDSLNSHFAEECLMTGTMDAGDTLYLATFTHDATTFHDGSVEHDAGFQGVDGTLVFRQYDASDNLISITQI